MSAPVFFNSAIVRAPESLMLKRGAWRVLDVKVRYGLWRHDSFGAVLIDTGYGSRVMQGSARGLALKVYAALLGPKLVEPKAALSVLAARGVASADVGVIIVTHFHADHIAALRDFPSVRFFASGRA